MRQHAIQNALLSRPSARIDVCACMRESDGENMCERECKCGIVIMCHMTPPPTHSNARAVACVRARARERYRKCVLV